MNATKTLTWVSRALFGLGLLLFAGLFVYMAVGSSATSVDANGQRFHSMSAGELNLFFVVFLSIAWCWLAGGAARTLATATSWPRALLEIASTVGFGLFFTAIVLLIFGTWSVILAVLIAIGGFVVASVAKAVSFIAFGAKDAVHAVEQVVDHVQHSIADAREHASLAPPVLRPGSVDPSSGIFTPQPTEPDRPSLGSQV